jgi:unsaturated rhamnogalacturonyl hydrolase
MLILKNFSIPLIIFTRTCQSVGQTNDQQTQTDSWLIRLAENVIQNHESLVYYDRSPGKEKLQYDIAMLAMAIDKLGSVDEKYSLYMKDYVDFFIDPTGNIEKYRVKEYSLDRICFAKNIISLYKRTGDIKYYSALQGFVAQIENHSKTNSGGFWHKKIYTWQMWLDGSYMAIPFIAQYAKEFNRPEWFDLAAWQLIHIYMVTLDDESGLLYHGWDESKTQKWYDSINGQSKIFLGRAVGWYCMAVVDVLEFLPDDHPKRQKLIEILGNTTNALLRVRDPDTGLWYQVLNQGEKPKNYIETSCSAMFTYALGKGVKFNHLPEAYKKYALESFDNLTDMFLIRDMEYNLTLKNTVGGCGLGGRPYRDGTYDYYVSEVKVDNDPKGVGALLLAAIEINK